MYCDLHTHSTASDGLTPPQHLAQLAQQAGVSALALTDHDTTAGLAAADEACREANISFVPGIELSADPKPLRLIPPSQSSATPLPLGTLHILGLFIDPTHPELLEVQTFLLQARDQRNPQIIANLQNLGVKIDYQEVITLAQKQNARVIGRPHIGQVLVNKGYAKSVQDAFARYIGEGKPAYARKDLLSPQRAIQIIHAAGGLAILAHPVQLRLPTEDDLQLAVKRLADMELDGIEIRHPDHTPANVEQYTLLAQQYHLLTSGGSDYHGNAKRNALNTQHVPLETYHRLHDAWQKRG